MPFLRIERQLHQKSKDSFRDIATLCEVNEVKPQVVRERRGRGEFNLLLRDKSNEIAMTEVQLCSLLVL